MRWQTSPRPVLDLPLRRISDFANHSKPWFIVAAALAAFGGTPERVAALTGVGAIGLTSFVVNQPMKLARRRERPDRPLLGVPESRWVLMPTSTSFPSGHAASAAAFAVAVGHLLPSGHAGPCDRRRPRSPSPGCTPASTIPATSSSEPRSAHSSGRPPPGSPTSSSASAPSGQPAQRTPARTTDLQLPHSGDSPDQSAVAAVTTSCGRCSGSSARPARRCRAGDPAR